MMETASEVNELNSQYEDAFDLLREHDHFEMS